jgi:N-acetylmuramoyl-L-alanine amidase
MVKWGKMSKGDNTVRRISQVFGLCITLILAFSLVPEVHGMTFNDIGESHRAKEEIFYLATGKIANGDLDGNFKPNSTVTRAEAAAMIGRALQLDGDQRATEFNDVGPNHFASGYIQEAAKLGIITGYRDGSFQPDKPVVRGEMALLISRAFEYNSTTITAASHQLLSMGIAQGMADGSFGAKQSIKRSDFAVFLARSMNAEMRLLGQEASFDKSRYVTTNNLNFRSGPSTLYSIKGKLNSSDEVKVAYYIGEWAYIESNSKQGFVHSAYLSKTDVTDIEGILKNKTLIIDPGHGDQDPGASGYGLLEKNVVLDTSIRLKNYLEDSPFNVKLTREKDVFLELGERVAFAEENNGDIFISVHANAFNGSATGTESYYYRSANNSYVKESKALATYLQNRLINAWNLSDRGVKEKNLHVLRENSMPASLVELGFIDNKSDNAKLASAEWRQKAAKALYLGILDYYYHYEGLKDISYLYENLGASPSQKLH